MSVSIANEHGILGQFASNGGYTDFVKESNKYPALQALTEHGGSEDVKSVLSDLSALMEKCSDDDVVSSAQELANLVKGESLIVVTRGETNGEDDVEDVEKAGSGVMLAFWPDAALQAKLAVKGGEAADQLHITLAYYGKELTEDDIAALRESVNVFAKTHAPVAGVLGGLGRFSATPQSDGQDVAYLSFYSDGIQDFRRELVELTKHYGVAPKNSFGYTPHMTLKFVAAHAPHLLPTPEAVPVTFSNVTLSIGGEKTEYPLTGQQDEHSFEFVGNITKLDKTRKLVFGWFSIISRDGKPFEDSQGDIIDEETLENCAYNFVLHAREGGEMHEIRGVGRLVESVVFTLEKQTAMVSSLAEQGITAVVDLGCVAWWGGFKIDSASSWDGVTTGRLRAWSIGGTGKRASIGADDLRPFVSKYSEDQPRDDHGRWSDGGGELSGPGKLSSEGSGGGLSKLPKGNPEREVAEKTIDLGRSVLKDLEFTDAAFKDAREKVAKEEKLYDRYSSFIKTEQGIIDRFNSKPDEQRTDAEYKRYEKAVENLDAHVRRQDAVLQRLNDSNTVVREKLAYAINDGKLISEQNPIIGVGSGLKISDVKNWLSDFNSFVGGSGNMKNGGVVTVKFSGQDGRSYYSLSQSAVVMQLGTTSRAIFFHEMGHWWEDRFPEVHTAAVSFLNNRTHGDPLESMNTIASRRLGWKVTGYTSDEKGQPDKFVDHYTGKRYTNDLATEVVSMGFQHMAQDPGSFYQKDPNHFLFTLGVIKLGHK